MESGKCYRWYGKEYTRKVRRRMSRNLDLAATFLVADIKKSFGDSGVTGTRSGATQSQRAANRSKPWGPPNIDKGHLKRNVGDDRPTPLRRRVGTGIGGKESVGYAMWLEFGTRKMLPRPFLRPALWRNRRRIRTALTKPLVF